jgi:FMN-dependent NADH-azoreductase
MNPILLVLSSPRGAASHSSRVARVLAERLAGGDRRLVTVRDLNREPVPPIDESFVVGRDLAEGQRSPAQQAAVELSDRLIDEVLGADTIVIASAMINFGISANLKAWIDHLVRPGVTFRYTEKGPEGLVKGKKLYLVKASGGVYSEGPMMSFNFQDTYLKHIFGFMGVADIEVLAIEGVAFGPEVAERAVAGALERVSRTAAPAASGAEAWRDARVRLG